MPANHFNASPTNGSLYLGDSNSIPTTLPLVSNATDGLALGAGAIASTGTRAFALGNSYASGSDALALQIGNNSSSYGATASNALAIGYQARASSTYSIAIGQGCSALVYGSVAIGSAALSQIGNYATAIGRLTTCSASCGTALGNGSNVSSTRFGVISHASGTFTTSGDAQESFSVARRQTTDATATSLLLDGLTATYKCGTIPNNSAWVFEGHIVGKTSGAGSAIALKVSGAIKRGGNASTTALVGTPSVSVVAADSALSSATASVSADTTNGTLDILVSGVAATPIDWVIGLKTTEVTF